MCSDARLAAGISPILRCSSSSATTIITCVLQVNDNINIINWLLSTTTNSDGKLIERLHLRGVRAESYLTGSLQLDYWGRSSSLCDVARVPHSCGRSARGSGDAVARYGLLQTKLRLLHHYRQRHGAVLRKGVGVRHIQTSQFSTTHQATPSQTNHSENTCEFFYVSYTFHFRQDRRASYSTARLRELYFSQPSRLLSLNKGGKFYVNQ